MTLSPTYSISDIINCVLATITFLGVCMTYRTLKEMQKQRLVSIKPNIILECNKCTQFEKSYLNKPRLGGMGLEIRNIGNGISKAITINVKIDDSLIKLSKCINVDNQKKLVFITYEDICAAIDKKCITELIEINALQVDENKLIELGQRERVIGSMFLANNVQDIYKFSRDVNPQIEIDIIYRDILNNKYISKYKLNMRVLNVSSDTNIKKDNINEIGLEDINNAKLENINISIGLEVKCIIDNQLYNERRIIKLLNKSK